MIWRFDCMFRDSLLHALKSTKNKLLWFYSFRFLYVGTRLTQARLIWGLIIKKLRSEVMTLRQNMASSVIRIVALLICVATGGLTAFAQTSRGTVTGIVRDSSGAVVSGASVTLTGNETGVSRSTTSNGEGVYRFDAVDPGTYALKVTATGFGGSEQTDIIVNAARVVGLDVNLSPGNTEDVVEVSAGTGAILQTQSSVRSGNLDTSKITQLPTLSRNPVSLTLTLPGVSTQRFAPGGVGSFSVNGSRGRSNNFLIDGTENNDISVAGQGFQITNPDAVQEVNIQTSNFDAEYGRAGGAVVNVITKSGTNQFHGTLLGLVDSSADDALTVSQKRAGITRVPVATDQTYAGTFGGPVIKNRTFFFGSYQERRFKTTNQLIRTAPSEAGVAALRNLVSLGLVNQQNVETYLNAIGGVRGVTSLTNVALGAAPNGTARSPIQFGLGTFAAPNTVKDRQLQVRGDHKFSDSDQLSVRYAYSRQDDDLASINFPGLSTSLKSRNQNAVISETHVFSPSLTNEFRIAYNRIFFEFPNDPPNELGLTLPSFGFQGLAIGGAVSGIGVASNLPQGRVANNVTFQDTMTYVRGNQTFRFGFDILNQRSRQFAPFVQRGILNFNASAGRTGFANFVDNFGGSGGSASLDFGSPAFFPSLVRQAYFFQDTWRITSSLTLSLGLRYERFGNPANSLRTPAFAGLFNVDPTTFTGPFSAPNRIDDDNNNFSPVIGFAYNPSVSSGRFFGLGRLLGDKKTVIRGGYQVGYDSFFNNIASNAQASSPNLISTNVQSVISMADPRGLANLSQQFPASARTPNPLDAQTLIAQNLRNPYYQRFSLGIQRELPLNLIFDISYVGTKGTALFINEDLNPLVPASLRNTPTGVTIPANRLSGRLDNLQGVRTIRTNGGDSIYHSLQMQMTRRFSNGLSVSGAYTYSKLIDNQSEVFATDVGGSLSQTPAILGGQRLDRAVSLFDRTQRLSINYLYELPFFREQRGVIGKIAGGFQVSGTTFFEGGVPFTIFNGQDADGLGGAGVDRPDFNPNGRRGVRAVPNATSPTGFVNPDIQTAANPAGIPINPMEAQFIGRAANGTTGALRAGTLGRNTERTLGTATFNFNIQKSVKIREGMKVEFRTEFFNLFNSPLFGAVGSNVFNAQPGTFFDTRFNSAATDLASGTSTARTIRYQLKLIF
jgi:outer membrane receptor protein involved in Fe transport